MAMADLQLLHSLRPVADRIMIVPTGVAAKCAFEHCVRDESRSEELDPGVQLCCPHISMA